MEVQGNEFFFFISWIYVARVNQVLLDLLYLLDPSKLVLDEGKPVDDIYIDRKIN